MVWCGGRDVPFLMSENQDMLPSQIVRYFVDILQHDLDKERFPIKGIVSVGYLVNGKKNTHSTMGCEIIFKRQIREIPNEYGSGIKKIINPREFRLAKFEYELKGGNYFPVYMFYGNEWIVLKNEIEMKIAVDHVINDPKLKEAMENLFKSVVLKPVANNNAVENNSVNHSAIKEDVWNIRSLPPIV